MKILSDNKLKPEKPIDTFEGLPKQFSLPELLKDEKTEKVEANGESLLFFKSVPKIGDFEKYNGHVPETKFIGGETQALKMMEEYMKDKSKVAQFKKPMTIPCSLKPDTTALSPYIKFGSLSSRTFYWRIQDIYNTHKNHS